MFHLRPYQQEAIDKSRELFARGKKRLIIQAPTGAGKTVIFSFIAKAMSEKGKRVLILTNRTELLTQAGGSIKSVGVDSYYIQAGCKVLSDKFNCYIAMAQTLRNRVNDEKWLKFIDSIDLVIIDECHLQDFNYIMTLIKDKYVLGFSATPGRTGKMRQLALDYEEIIETVDVKWLVDNGYLVNDDYYGCNAPDLNGVGIDRMKGDYKENELFNRFNTPQLYDGVLKNWLDICPDTKTLVFCVNIEHSVKTAIEFYKKGIICKFICSDVAMPKEGKTPAEITRYNEKKRVYDLIREYKHLTGSREEVIQGFLNNEYKVLINAGILTAGFDCPDIETIVLNRATTSKTLLYQMIGRGSRIAEGKTHFNILDFGGNCQRLGYYTQPQRWSLWHDERGNGNGLPPIKDCQECLRPILATYKICPFCGFKFPTKELKSIELSGVMLQGNKAVATKRIKDMTNRELADYCKAKGHKPAWLWRQLWYKGRETAIKDFANEFYWSGQTIQKAIYYCKSMN